MSRVVLVVEESRVESRGKLALLDRLVTRYKISENHTGSARVGGSFRNDEAKKCLGICHRPQRGH